MNLAAGCFASFVWLLHSGATQLSSSVPLHVLRCVCLGVCMIRTCIWRWQLGPQLWVALLRSPRRCKRLGPPMHACLCVSWCTRTRCVTHWLQEVSCMCVLPSWRCSRQPPCECCLGCNTAKVSGSWVTVDTGCTGIHGLPHVDSSKGCCDRRQPGAPTARCTNLPQQEQSRGRCVCWLCCHLMPLLLCGLAVVGGWLGFDVGRLAYNRCQALCFTLQLACVGLFFVRQELPAHFVRTNGASARTRPLVLVHSFSRLLLLP